MLIVKNAASLDFSFVHGNLPAREAELEMLRNIVMEPLKSGVSSTIIIYGPSGTGKTVTAKYLLRYYALSIRSTVQACSSPVIHNHLKFIL